MTLDTHGEDYADTQEGRFLPVSHCVRGTEGWRFPPEVEALRESLGARVYEKPTFGSTSLVSELKRLYDEAELESVELVGLCTDICVISNALMIKAAMPELCRRRLLCGRHAGKARGRAGGHAQLPGHPEIKFTICSHSPRNLMQLRYTFPVKCV